MSQFNERLLQNSEPSKEFTQQHKEKKPEEQENNQGEIIKQDSQWLYFFTGDTLMKIDKRENKDDSEWKFVEQTPEIVFFITNQGSKISINRRGELVKQKEAEILHKKEFAEVEKSVEWHEKPITKIESSAQHIHLSEKTFYALFGEGAVKAWRTDLSQPGQYALDAKVILVNEKSGKEVSITVTILGPFRKEDQVEISKTIARQLGIETMRRDSGDLEGTPGITLRVMNKKTENGKEVKEIKEVKIDKGVIEAKTHIHLSDEEAAIYGLSDKQETLLKIIGKNGKFKVIIPVTIKISKNFKEALHVDTDQWNAYDLDSDDVAFIVKK